MGDRQVTPFFRFGPRIDISTSGNLGRFLQKFYGLAQQKSVFIGISGVWGAKKRPTKASIAPTALRSGGNCLFSSSGICNDFLLVAITPLCLRRPRQCEPHPRSWRTIRHEKPRALKPWARCSKVLLSNNKLIQQPRVHDQFYECRPRCAAAAVGAAVSYHLHSVTADAGLCRRHG